MGAMPRPRDPEHVLNQSPPYVDVDLYGSDQPLRDAVAANGGGEHATVLAEFGCHWGTAEMFDLAREANENPPKLRRFDPRGFRLDIVEFIAIARALRADPIKLLKRLLP